MHRELPRGLDNKDGPTILWRRREPYSLKFYGAQPLPFEGRAIRNRAMADGRNGTLFIRRTQRSPPPRNLLFPSKPDRAANSATGAKGLFSSFLPMQKSQITLSIGPTDYHFRGWGFNYGGRGGMNFEGHFRAPGRFNFLYLRQEEGTFQGISLCTGVWKDPSKGR